MLTQKKTTTGFKYIEIQNNSATAKVALQGGHIFHFQQQEKKPLLWLSRKSHFETGKAIRGGIPLCWPWFGKHPTDAAMPQHGFARTAVFECMDSNEPDEKTTEIVLKLESSAKTLIHWPYQFKLLLHITIDTELTVELTTINCDTQSFVISSALHSYFAVSDIKQVSVQGLDKAEYWDKLTGETKNQQGSLCFNKEVDRIYQNTTDPIQLLDRERRIQIVSEGSKSAVLWNPWKEKSIKMADMPDDGYRSMICIETANALNDSRRLVPGEEHTLNVTLSEFV